MEWLRIFIAFFASIALFINAAIFLPQIMSLIRKGDSSGVSLITFLGFNFIQLALLLHAYIQKDWIAFVGWILSLITCGTVSLLIIYYRLKKQA